MKNGLLLFGCFFLFHLAAANAPLIRVDDPIERPQVAQTGTLLEIRDASADNRKATPPGVLASLIAAPDTRYEWSPSPDTGLVTGGADLADARLSPDESTLMILERIGGAEKANSTRIIFFNLLNEKLIRAYTFQERKLTRARFVPGESTLIAVQGAQEPFDQPDKLLAINLKNGKIVSESAPLPTPVQSVAANGSHCFVTLTGEEYFYCYPVDGIDGTPLRIRTLIPNAGLALSPAGDTLMLYGPKRLELYRIAGGKAELLGSREFDIGGTPSWGLLIDDQGDEIVLAVPDGKALFFAGGVARELEERSAGTGSYEPDGKKLLLGIGKNDSLSVYTLPGSVRPERTVSPGTLRPNTRGRNFRVFFLTGSEAPEVLVLDRRANLSRIQIREKRWQKKVIYSAPK